MTVSVTEDGDMFRGTPPASVTFGAGNAQATLRVPTQADTTDENDSVITATVTAASNAPYSAGNPSIAMVTVRDDDAPGVPVVTIRAGPTPVPEGTDATFTLSRTGATTAALTMTVNVTEDGDMFRGTPPASVTFGAGNAQATLTVLTQADTDDENDSVITAQITANAAYSAGNPSTAMVTVRDDDVPDLPEVTISAGPSPVAEGTDATFTLSRTGATTAALTVTVNVTEDRDMLRRPAPSSVRFNAGDVQATLAVPTQADATDENDSVITVQITANAAYSVGVPASATVTVQDDDVPTVTIMAEPSPVTEGTDATFTLNRTGVITGSLTVAVDVRESGDMILGTPPFSVTFNADEPQATLAVPTQADATDENDSVITARVTANPAAYLVGMPASATVTVQDDDMPTVTIMAGTSPVPEGTDATFTLSRRGVTTGTLTVRVNVEETGDMILGTAPSSVTFSAGNAQATLTVPTQPDTTEEDDSVITAEVTSALDASYAIGVPFSDSVTVQDDDAAPDLPVVTVIPGTTPVTEGTDATFTLSRTGATTGTLTVTVDVGETGTMISGIAPSSVTFEAGDTQATLTVPTQADATDENDSVITARITADPGAYSVGTDASATVTVRDDDLPMVTITAGTTPVSEGADATFTLSRTGTTTTTLTVTVEVDETGTMIRGTPPNRVTFGVGDTQATLTVPTQADAMDENDSVITATVMASSGYLVGAPSTDSVTVEDDDTPGLPVVTVTAGPTPVPEGTDATFTLSRTDMTTGTLTVTVEVDETGMMISGAAPAGATFDAEAREVTLTVQTEADAVEEDDSAITMRVTVSSGYSVGTAFSATVTVRDDDGPAGTTRDGDESSRLKGGVNDELLPRITQAMLSSTLSAISNRMDMPTPGSVDSQGAHSFGKASSPESVLASLSAATERGSPDLKRLLAGKSFFLPLNTAESGPGNLALWGRGDYRDLRGGNDRPLEWDGDLANIHLGADMWLRPNLLAGLAVSWSEGDFYYEGAAGCRERGLRQ